MKEKKHSRIFIGMLIALIGVLIIIISPLLKDGFETLGGSVEGNMLLVIATIGATATVPLLKKLLDSYSVEQVNSVSFILSAILFMIFMVPEQMTWSFRDINSHGIIGILFGVFLSSFIAYYLFTYGMKRILTQEVGLFSYICPVTAVIIAIPLLGEYPDTVFFIGSLLVFGGIFIAEKRIHWHPIGKLKDQK
jgi:drug/metabolite transporter (DMT)-like permease